MAPTRFHILLIEDSAADVRLVSEALQLHEVDCQLTVIRDGSQAIDYAAALAEQPLPPHLVMLDLNLPKADGFEVLEALRATPAGQTLPVIVFSSSGAERDRSRAALLKADAYFRKPLEIDEFMKIGILVKGMLGCAEVSE